MGASFKTNESVTDLINEAQDVAIGSMSGESATKTTLLKLARRVKGNILTQVALGRWRAIGVTDPDDFMDLAVAAVPGNTLRGEPSIKVLYDFKNTTKPYLVVDAVKRAKEGDE